MTNLPKIALGAWAWGNDGTFGNALTAENLKPVFDTAMANGLNLWDTAYAYGMGTSEKILAERDKRMKMIKRLLTIPMVFTTALSLASCGSSTKDESAEAPAAEEQNTPAETAETAAEETASVTEETADAQKVLVAYFSATGTTKGVAEKIASVTGADLYEIQPAEPYTEADLNYNDSSTRATVEQNDKNARPEIASEDVSMQDYTTAYLGFPIWWGGEPRILDTFVEKYSFEGITVIPFCTSGSSPIGRSGSNMEALAGSGTWLEGRRFSGDVSEEDLKSWIESLN